MRYFQKDNAIGVARSDEGAQALIAKGYAEISPEDVAAEWQARDMARMGELIAAAVATQPASTPQGKPRIYDAPPARDVNDRG